MREITPEQAAAARKILEEECGFPPDPQGREGFVRTISDPKRDCREYRFMGSLGFGGKFRNNGNRDDTPYVDCYPENETLGRNNMIERANKRLAELFGTGSPN